jgi:hypothetical protein
MTSDSTLHNRLLLEISNGIRRINRETINPEIPELTLDGLKPVMQMVADARSRYLQQLFAVSKTAGEEGPSVDDIKRLKNLRLIYEELSSGARALQTAIERGYLDVSQSNGEVKETGGDQ